MLGFQISVLGEVEVGWVRSSLVKSAGEHDTFKCCNTSPTNSRVELFLVIIRWRGSTFHTKEIINWPEMAGYFVEP